jgi:putative FmdB family regulatory protein
MNAERVPFEAPKERSRVCFGGFRLPARSRFGEGRPSETCAGATGFNPWGSTLGKERDEMPSYEYRCPSCKKKFTVILSMREHEARKAKCPKCGGKKLEQLISQFMAKTSRKS